MPIRRVTDEMYARIPELRMHMSIPEIAALYNVAPTSLKVMCSKHGVSLRKGGRPPPRTVLKVHDETIRSLKRAARGTGRNAHQLATVLLDRIVSDNLLHAVLDEA